MITLTLTANQAVTFAMPGKFLRLMSSVGALNVTYFQKGAMLAEALAVSGGYAETFDEQFDRVTLLSTTTQAVTFVIRDRSRVDYDAPPTGAVTISGTPSVSVSNNNGAFVNAAATVTNASAQLVATSTTRRYLLIQNRDATGNIYVRFASAATVATGIKIGPGESWESGAFCPTGIVYAIGDIASNANVITVTG